MKDVYGLGSEQVRRKAQGEGNLLGDLVECKRMEEQAGPMNWEEWDRMERKARRARKWIDGRSDIDFEV